MAAEAEQQAGNAAWAKAFLDDFMRDWPNTALPPAIAARVASLRGDDSDAQG